MERLRTVAGDTDTTMQGLHWAESTAAACEGVEMVIESLPEDVALKQQELARAQSVAPQALLGTNTSSLSVTEVARGLADPAALAGTHYLNPPTLFRVMELVPGERTSPAVMDRFEEIFSSLGLAPVRLRKDAAGFVLNRLQFALLREATELVESGVVAPEDLDRMVAEGLAPRWVAAGPLTTALLGGSELFDTLAGRLYPHLSRRTVLDESVVKQQPDADTLVQLRAEREQRLRSLLA